LFDVDGTLVDSMSNLRRVWRSWADHYGLDGERVWECEAWGVVTGNYRHRTLMRFGRLGLPVPRVLVDASSVRKGKPGPEGYLAAAQELGHAAADCLVIEDSAAGVEAGVRARMTVWSVGAIAVDGAHRHYQSLEAAGPDTGLTTPQLPVVQSSARRFGLFALRHSQQQDLAEDRVS